MFDILSQCDNLIYQRILPSKVAIGSRVFEIPLELVPSTLLDNSHITVNMVNRVVDSIIHNPKAVLRHRHSSVCQLKFYSSVGLFYLLRFC